VNSSRRPNLEFGQLESPGLFSSLRANKYNERQVSDVLSGRDHVRLRVFLVEVKVKVKGLLTKELLSVSREFTEETSAQKFRRRLREEPLIPLGMPLSPLLFVQLFAF
jgi:hypothetical protein